MIEIRKTEITELAILMDIFEQGKRIMRKNGNTKQWTGGYPTEEIIKKDIENGQIIAESNRGKSAKTPQNLQFTGKKPLDNETIL